MATNYVQAGDIINWVNGSGSAISSGDVVAMGQVLGVALVDIANGASGAVGFKGVYTVAKVSAAVIAQGESLSWDKSAAAFDDNAATAATGDITGAPAMAAEAAGNGVTSFDVLFTGAPGTLT